MKKIIPVRVPSFALLVKFLKLNLDKADAFEVNLDAMRVKGDLAVIQAYFKKPLIARSESMDLLKRAAKSNWPYVILPEGMQPDLEFRNLLKNKGTRVLHSLEDFS